MYFWLIAALLTVAAALAVMAPFLREPRRRAAVEAHDFEVYSDQLAEVERDVSRGLIGESEAGEARAEIGRRILKLQDKTTVPERPRSSQAARLTAAAAVLAVPLISWVLYAVIGSPGLPSEPLQARLEKDPEHSTIQELVARAEAHLANNPEDGRGWDVLAPIYFRLERYADAETAYRHAIHYAGDSAAREAGLGETLTAHAGGVVSADAESAFESALALDENNHKARFYLALAKAQDGKSEEAGKMWRAMAEDLPADSPWRSPVEQALAGLGEPTQAASAGEGTSGPGSEEIEAASSMTAQDRQSMIEGMVAKLDQRLREQPDDMQGWQRLVRSYLVLGREDDAKAALERGVKALGATSDSARDLRAFAASQGIETR